jgi:hypothetical protein
MGTFCRERGEGQWPLYRADARPRPPTGMCCAPARMGGGEAKRERRLLFGSTSEAAHFEGETQKAESQGKQDIARGGSSTRRPAPTLDIEPQSLEHFPQLSRIVFEGRIAHLRYAESHPLRNRPCLGSTPRWNKPNENVCSRYYWLHLAQCKVSLRVIDIRTDSSPTPSRHECRVSVASPILNTSEESFFPCHGPCASDSWSTEIVIHPFLDYCLPPRQSRHTAVTELPLGRRNGPTVFDQLFRHLALAFWA